MNYRFNLKEWLPRFSLDPNAEVYSGKTITSPSQLCNNELLRQAMHGEYHWGEPVPVDVFVMADGEPENRWATKIGGLPYRSADDPWPTTDAGEPLPFLAQFNFSDSRDIVGDLPGDLLLIYANLEHGFVQSIGCEWQSTDVDNLIGYNELPMQVESFNPCFGYICRTLSFPDAHCVVPEQKQRYPKCHGKDVWADFFLLQYQATQIGAAPFFVQGDPQLPGRILCTISSVQPRQHDPYPWVNRPEPLMPAGEWNLDQRHLMLGDMGCIYLSIDDDGDVHWGEACS